MSKIVQAKKPDIEVQVNKLIKSHCLEKINPIIKDFILVYYQSGNLVATTKCLNISIEDAVSIYKEPRVQEVLRELNLERHRLMFSQKMLNLEEIGSYLSNVILDTNISDDNKLSARDKLDAAKLLLEVHNTINNSLSDPVTLNNYEILDMQFKDLSVNTIKSLLSNVNNDNKKPLITNYSESATEQVIDELNKLNNIEVKKIKHQQLITAKNKLMNEVDKIKK